MRPYDLEPNYVEELMMSANSGKYHKYKEQQNKDKSENKLKPNYSNDNLSKLEFLQKAAQD